MTKQVKIQVDSYTRIYNDGKINKEKYTSLLQSLLDKGLITQSEFDKLVEVQNYDK